MPLSRAARTAATIGSDGFMPRNMLSIRSAASSRPRRSAKRRSNSCSSIRPVSSSRRSASAAGSSRNRRLIESSARPLSRQKSAKLSQTELVSTPPKSTSRPL